MLPLLSSSDLVHCALYQVVGTTVIPMFLSAAAIVMSGSWISSDRALRTGRGMLDWHEFSVFSQPMACARRKLAVSGTLCGVGSPGWERS